MKHNFIQYELWKECSNGCIFCFNKGQEDHNKIETMNNAIKSINSDELNDYDEIGLIGGELFDYQLNDIEVKNKFFEVVDAILDKMDKQEVNKFYITSNLLYKNLTHITDFLNHVNLRGHLHQTLLCTSYDLIGRFNAEGKKELWESNMKKLHYMYPRLMLHTEVIVTGAFVDAVLNGDFNINNFKEEFHTDMDYLQPNSGFYYKTKSEMESVLPGFFPTRDNFLKFLNKTVSEGTIDINRIFNRNLQSDTVYVKVNGEYYKITNRRKKLTLFPCDSIEKSGYLDSDIPMKDDVDKLKELMYE